PLSHDLSSPTPPPFPTRRSSDLLLENEIDERVPTAYSQSLCNARCLGGKGSLAALPSLIILVCQKTAMSGIHRPQLAGSARDIRSEEHTSELQSRFDIVCRLLLE